MGYVVWHLETRFRLRQEFHERALERVKTLHWGMSSGLLGLPKHPEIQRLGAYDGRKVVQAATLVAALNEWGWLATCESDLDDAMLAEEPEGDIVDLEYVGPKMRVSDNTRLFQAIAEFPDDGSYVAMTGEDKLIWRWLFTKGRCVRQPGHLVFDDPPFGLT